MELEADELELPYIHYDKPVIISTVDYIRIMKSLTEPTVVLQVTQDEVIFSTSSVNLEIILRTATVSANNTPHNAILPLKLMKNLLKLGGIGESIEIYTSTSLPLKIIYDYGLVFYINLY